MAEVNPEFRAFFMEKMREIALEHGETPEQIEANGPFGFDLITSIEAMEMFCETEDRFGVDLSDYESIRSVEDIEARIESQKS